MTTHKRACHLCEAICGIEIEVEGGAITAIRGDKDDPLSQGHICPKATALADIYLDPDRLRAPVKRAGDQWQQIPWEEAFDLVAEGLVRNITKNGRNSVAAYIGNPGVHNYGLMTHASQMLGPIGSKQRFSATSVDQLPHQLVALWLFGHQLLVPIPDIDHADYMLMLGANPMASNGSLMTVPNFPKRLKALKARGGKLVVLDPRRTETAEKASEHVFIKPGSDAVFLAALVNVLFVDGLVNLGRLADFVEGVEDIESWVQPFSPEVAADVCGIGAKNIRRIAREFASAESAACYGRMGCSTQSFGTLCQWLIQVINVLTGNLDKPGGVLFTEPAVDMVHGPIGKPGSFDHFRSRVSGLPEFSGEIPASCLAEEITTPGDDQVTALVTIAGNPVLSVPAGNELEAALSELDFMVSVDPKINETTRYADVILPPTNALEHDHYDMIFNTFAVRNTAKYSQPLFEKPEGAKHDWEIFTEVGERISTLLGREPRPTVPPHAIIENVIKHSSQADKVSLEKLKAHPEGIDIGPLRPSLPERLYHADKRIKLTNAYIQPAFKDLGALLESGSKGLRLIGRRHVRDNNSWMHEHHRLIKGKNRCTLLIHPDDAQSRGLVDGTDAAVSSDIGSITLPVEISDSMMPGVVSVPHGYGHGRNPKSSVTAERQGVSVNDIVPRELRDGISGNAAVNGVPVEVATA